MRTTVDIPPALHTRAQEIARARHQSLSAVIAELAVRGLASMGEPVTIHTDDLTRLPTIRIGRPVTSADVADLLDDE